LASWSKTEYVDLKVVRDPSGNFANFFVAFVQDFMTAGDMYRRSSSRASAGSSQM